MNTRTLGCALALSAAMVGSASAAWVQGQPIAVNGGFAGLDGDPALWGTWANQGSHELGGFSSYEAPIFGGSVIMVESTVLSPTAISIVLDFSDFPFTEVGTHYVSLPDLKAPGTELLAGATAGLMQVQGTSVFWAGAVGEIGDGQVKITIEQVPAPGAIALVGLAGLAGRRRRA